MGNEEIAEALNRYFMLIFTVEDTNNLPVIDDKETKVAEDLDTIIIMKEVMLGKPLELKMDKSPGPDGMHCRVLKEMAGVTANVLMPSINTTNIETLLVATDQAERIVEPPENIQEKVAFIFNNLSQSNMTQKVEELKETVKDEFMPWVSQYLVMKRVSIEPNFHSLYSNFMDTLKNSEFNKMVLTETYRNIKDLDVKSLLLEAYVKGQQEMLYVVPFVAKVLESSVRSMPICD
eukprot:g44942.t1